jgi:hypothetical protein
VKFGPNSRAKKVKKSEKKKVKKNTHTPSNGKYFKAHFFVPI